MQFRPEHVYTFVAFLWKRRQRKRMGTITLRKGLENGIKKNTI